MALVDVGLDNGDLPINWTTTRITGLDLIKQRIEVRLRLFLGEFIQDQTKGLPFVDWVTRKPAPLQEIQQTVQAEIEDVPGVLRMEDVTTVFTIATRTVLFTGTVVTEADERTGVTVTVLGEGANVSPAVIFFAQSGGIATGGGGL